jgi:hypothetical protein
VLDRVPSFVIAIFDLSPCWASDGPGDLTSFTCFIENGLTDSILILDLATAYLQYLGALSRLPADVLFVILYLTFAFLGFLPCDVTL